MHLSPKDLFWNKLWKKTEGEPANSGSPDSSRSTEVAAQATT